MAVQLTIVYEQIVQLVEQLDQQQQVDLTTHLLERLKAREISSTERRLLFNALTVDLGAVSAAYSDRREDWYDDDGR